MYIASALQHNNGHTAGSRVLEYSCRFVTKQPRIALQSGFQLIEMIIALSILAIVSLFAIPSYSSYLDKIDFVTTKTEIRDMAQIIEQYYSGQGDYPNSLADIGKGDLLDPWGNNYRYLKIYGVKLRGRDRARKDKHLAPVNSDFDLYSIGKDEVSRPSFRAKRSYDDIVRCSDGQFIGYAADF